MANGHEDTHAVSYATYGLVWAVLIALTLLLSAFYLFNFAGGRYNNLAALVISPVKASLVAYFFMHLKYEKPIFRVMLAVTLAILVIFLGLTFVDVAWR
jgi:cytochrome c oxidase subunit 4